MYKVFKDVEKQANEFINKNNLKEVGPTINITHGMKQVDSDIIVDLEIMQPVDREVWKISYLKCMKGGYI